MLHDSGIVASFFVIFAAATCLSVAALFTRQPLILAYVLGGCLAGPHGFGLVADADLISEIAEIGIIFLLFLIGLDLQPGKLRKLFGQSLVTAFGSGVAFFAVGGGIAHLNGLPVMDALVVGIAMVFSSTIIGIKLLPTTVLHHRHIGEIVIGQLLLQDLLAILALLLVAALAVGGSQDLEATLLRIALGLPLLIAGAGLAVRYLLLPLIHRFDAFHEFLFITAVGWCLALANLAKLAGLSFELGAFVAGVSLATSPIAQYLAEQLRPLRDFFLVMFFFAIGASINLLGLASLWLPIVGLAAAVLLLKPLVFAGLLRWQGEPQGTASEVGWRLGQASEFSLLLSFAAGTVLSPAGSALIQGATVLTFVVSSYLVVLRYPSPIAVDPGLRRV